MSKKHKVKAKARSEREARQARRVVTGIFIGLIAAMVVALLSYYIAVGA